MKAIQGNKFAAGLLDCYLAKTAYSGQQTDEPVDPNRPNNLFQPVCGDQGAHGNFDEEERPSSYELWGTTHRPWLALAGVGIAALAGIMLFGRNG